MERISRGEDRQTKRPCLVKDTALVSIEYLNRNYLSLLQISLKQHFAHSILAFCGHLRQFIGLPSCLVRERETSHVDYRDR